MPRKASIRWHKRANAWRSDVGPVGKNGRRTPVYFRNDDGSIPSQRQAEDRLDAYLRERDRFEAAAARSGRDPSVWQVVEAYLQHAEKTVEPRTVDTHAERLATWMKRSPSVVSDAAGVMDIRPASTLKASDLARVAKAMTAEGRKPHYVAGMVASVKACWAWAARHEEDRIPQKVVPEDVFKDVKGPRIPQPPERYMPSGQAKALLAFIEDRADRTPGLTGEFDRMTALLYRCLYVSGARPSELCRATWKDFDNETGVIVLQKHKTGDKVGKPRRVPLSAVVVDRIRKLKDRKGAHPDYIFTHRRGKGSSSRNAVAEAGEPWSVGPLGQKFRKLRIEAAAADLDIRVRNGSGQVPDKEPECTLYDFRRTFSTDSDDTGFSDEHTAAAMGNSPEMVARIYKTRHARAAVALVEAVAKKREQS